MKKKKNKQSIAIDIPVAQFQDTPWKGELDKLPPNQTFYLNIDYPIDGPGHSFLIKTGKHGLGLIGLLNEIGSAYEEIYKAPERNRVYGHSINDLIIEGINIDFKNKLITLDVGS